MASLCAEIAGGLARDTCWAGDGGADSMGNGGVREGRARVSFINFQRGFFWRMCYLHKTMRKPTCRAGTTEQILSESDSRDAHAPSSPN